MRPVEVPGRLGRARVILALCISLLGLGAVGLVVSARMHDHAADRPGGFLADPAVDPAPDATVPAVAVVEGGSASAALLTPEDVAFAGWKAADCGCELTPAVLREHICGSEDWGLPAHLSGASRQFQRSHLDGDLPSGRIDATVLVAPTDADAEREISAVDSPGYAACVRARAVQIAQLEILDEVGLPTEVTLDRADLDLGVPGVVDRLAVTLHEESGQDVVVHIAFVRMQIGRAIVRMPIHTLVVPIGDAELAQIARAQIERVRVTHP